MCCHRAHMLCGCIWSGLWVQCITGSAWLLLWACRWAAAVCCVVLRGQKSEGEIGESGGNGEERNSPHFAGHLGSLLLELGDREAVQLCTHACCCGGQDREWPEWVAMPSNTYLLIGLGRIQQRNRWADMYQTKYLIFIYLFLLPILLGYVLWLHSMRAYIRCVSNTGY